MTKLTLSDVTNLQNEGSAVLTLHNNNVATVAAVENTISRDGTAPNQMTADLDMNSNQVINVGSPSASGDAISKSYLEGNAVLYTSAQSLTVSQKAQARDNIGATAGAGGGGGGGGVDSFNGRTGVVASTAGDYTATQITNTPAGGISAVTVQAAITELDTEKTGLNSPAFTGVPTAPTAAPGNNTTQLATTAYADAINTALLASRAPLASPTFTGTPAAPTAAPGTNTTQLATTAFTAAAVAASVSAASPPQGRITLASVTPVMTTNQAAKTTIFYTPYVGNQIPIYNGTNMIMTAFAELSVSTTDTTKSPAAIGASKLNDWFVWNDSGTIRIGHGADWTNPTTRSLGLTSTNGIWLNTSSITNGPAALRGTYVGTTVSNGSSQLDWINGAVSANGTAAFFGVWNTYNRRPVYTQIGDNTDFWTYATSAWRASDGSNTMRASFVSGLTEDPFKAKFMCHCSGSAGGAIGIGYDSTLVRSGFPGEGNNAFFTELMAEYGTTATGFHFMQAIEYAVTASAVTFYGDFADDLHQNALVFEGDF